MHYWVRRAAARVWSHMSPAYQIGDVVRYINNDIQLWIYDQLGVIVEINEDQPCCYGIQFIGNDRMVWCLPASIRSVDEETGTDQPGPPY